MEIENIKIVDINSEGFGVGRAPDFSKVLFIKNAVVEEVVNAKVTKEEANFAFADLTKIVHESRFKTAPKCQHYGMCGGCQLQHITPEGQLNLKQKQVEDAFRKIAKLEKPNILPILPSKQEFYYRNKMDYQFSNLSWIVNEGEEKLDIKKLDRRVLGLHISGRFDRVLDIQNCHLHGEGINKIRNFVRDFCLRAGATFYNPKYKKGVLRNLIFRTNSKGEIMVLIIFGEPPKVLQANLCMALKTEFPEITSIFYAVNKKEKDNIEEAKFVAFKGEDFLREKIDGLTFKINARSFFQINTPQTEELVRKVLEIGSFNKTDIVYDLYCGVGTFALHIARHVQNVVGIESSKFSIKDANENAKENSITNAKFIKGDVSSILTEEFLLENGHPTVMVVDPPRAGLSAGLIQKISEIKPKKLIYISCNPSTLARDISLLKENKLELALPIDMFPQTTHVETICLLTLI